MLLALQEAPDWTGTVSLVVNAVHEAPLEHILLVTPGRDVVAELKSFLAQASAKVADSKTGDSKAVLQGRRKVHETVKTVGADCTNKVSSLAV